MANEVCWIIMVPSMKRYKKDPFKGRASIGSSIHQNDEDLHPYYKIQCPFGQYYDEVEKNEYLKLKLEKTKEYLEVEIEFGHEFHLEKS